MTGIRAFTKFVVERLYGFAAKTPLRVATPAGVRDCYWRSNSSAPSSARADARADASGKARGKARGKASAKALPRPFVVQVDMGTPRFAESAILPGREHWTATIGPPPSGGKCDPGMFPHAGGITVALPDAQFPTLTLFACDVGNPHAVVMNWVGARKQPPLHRIPGTCHHSPEAQPDYMYGRAAPLPSLATEAVARRIGPLLEQSATIKALFPEGVNIGFCDAMPIAAGEDIATLKLCVWERGAGFTQACGTGATAAACVAAARDADRNVGSSKWRVELPGGALDITIERATTDDGTAPITTAWMEGPVTECYQGSLQM